MTTATATTPTPLFAAFADLVATAGKPAPRRCPALPRMRVDDRDGQRLLDELRALPDAPAALGYRL